MASLKYARIAEDADLSLKSNASPWWRTGSDWPHIRQFDYEVYVKVDDDDIEDEDGMVFPEDSDIPVRKIGTLSGYVISHDGSLRNLNIWDEADALDGEVESYVAQIKEELKACNEVFDAPEIEDFRCVVIVRDFSVVDGIDSVSWIAKAVATLASKEKPNLLLVDPRVMPDIPGSASATEIIQASWSAAANLKATAHAHALAALGLTQMVTSGHMWGWSEGKL